jgi:hypothetical protein
MATPFFFAGKFQDWPCARLQPMNRSLPERILPPPFPVLFPILTILAIFAIFRVLKSNPGQFTGDREPGGLEKKFPRIGGRILARQGGKREARWTESIAVGSKPFGGRLESQGSGWSS